MRFSLAVFMFDWLRRFVEGAGARADGGADSPVRPETDNDCDLDLLNPFPEPVSIEIRDIIDLHTIPPRDVKRVVEEYLNEAHHSGFRSVRIIHGKGIGLQRQAVRTILARTPFVEGWTDAPPEAGGLGATIVRLTPSRDIS